MVVFDKHHASRICYFEDENECVKKAANDLVNDIHKISLDYLNVITQNCFSANSIFIGTVKLETVRHIANEADVDVSGMLGKWEQYQINIRDDEIYLLGSDERGTMWAIYEFSRIFLGVDPMYLFTGNIPEKRSELILNPVIIMDAPRKYRFRGWFINDEDLIEGFCCKGKPEKGYDFHNDYSEMLSMVVETCLRLKQNLLIPASHIDMENPAHRAIVKYVTDRGMYISMHHQEPVGVNQQRLKKWYEKKGDHTDNINYVDHPEKYARIWRHFIRQWAQYPNVIWQLGLRGVGDRPVWFENNRIPDTIEARGALISKAIQEQWNIIAEETGTSDFLSSTTLWMEGMPLYKAGTLVFPKSTMVILSDFGPNQMWEDEYYETPRHVNTVYGGYYHACFWGCGPHLVQGNRIEKIAYNMSIADKMNSDAYSVLNVSNIREHVLPIAAMAKATWDFSSFDCNAFMDEWISLEYRNADVSLISNLYKKYYDAFAHLEDRRISGSMLLMDGMCKRLSDMLLRILDGNELSHPDFQNKRLFNFNDTDAFISFYKSLTEGCISAFNQIIEEAVDISALICEERREFFNINLLLQAVTAKGLYGVVYSLCIAAEEKRGSQNVAAIADALSNSIKYLDDIEKYRNASTSEKWAHWWDGDRLMNISGMRNTIETVRASYIQK